jgi:glycosyltransferase involved in cell wall biosynthesis
VLILRKKRTTDPARVAALRARGLKVDVVPGWSHGASILSLAALCREYRPDILVAHGFPEHLIGRHAAGLAKVPHRIQVEHNSRERYTAWRRLQARWLRAHTDRFVGVSEGVRSSLLALGTPPERTLAIPNGIDLAPFATAAHLHHAHRLPGIVMAARFAGQKDHATLLRAVALLRARGLQPPVLLAGQGSRSHLRAAQSLSLDLGLGEQVQFLGHRADLPALLMSHQIGVLATHYEGMPLSLVEAMAAGMAVVASDVLGVREVIENGVTGLLVPEADPSALAEALHQLLTDPERAATLAAAGRRKAFAEHSRALTLARYDALFAEVAP